MSGDVLQENIELVAGLIAEKVEAAMGEMRAENEKLRATIEEYADHQSWRCAYRSRYGECCCGLDDTLKELGLPIVEVVDPEANK